MRKCYIIFEYWDDVKCDKQHESPYEKDKNGKPKQYRCNNPIHCARIVRLITTDKDLAITLTKNRPELGYQEEILWTSL